MFDEWFDKKIKSAKVRAWRAGMVPCLNALVARIFACSLARQVYVVTYIRAEHA